MTFGIKKGFEEAGLFVGGKTLCGKLFVFGAGAAIVGVGINADATSWSENAGYLDIFRIHQFDKVFHDGVDAVFVKIAVVAETEKIEFEAFAFDHADIGNVADADFGKVGLTSNGA